ncbi:uncharacterized protein LOC114866305 [Betta splendens]|uniref:Uncharacterized protein LOC114866305 n=1 Tax=Betta splendens TaxID=158456 RepID=A0A6P7NVF7_BETSP|nr:uncharacterized protein LOC114866305 [Betta splendens]
MSTECHCLLLLIWDVPVTCLRRLIKARNSTQLIADAARAMASASLLVLAAFLLVCVHLFRPTRGQPVALGDSFNFSLTQCPSGSELELQHILLNTPAVLVSSRDGTGSWNTSASYAERLEPSHSALVLTNINYNDGGLYEFTCGDEDVRIQLDVVVPIKFSVFENETVLLPCHAVTAEGDVKSVRWETGGQRVAAVNVTSKNITYKAGFDLRASVPSDWFSTGDFTLTLGPVRLQDRGDWTCYVQDKAEVVARLTVQKTRNETSTEQSGPLQVNEGMSQENGGQTACVAIAVVVALVLCAVAFGIGWWMRPRVCPPPPPPRAQREGAQEDVPLSSLNDGVQPNGLA